MRRYLRKALFLVLAVQLGILSARAQQWAGVPSNVVMPVSQENSEFCWAASSSFLLNYYGFAVNQDQVALRAHGNVAALPGSDADIATALNAWIPLPGGSKRVIHASRLAGMLTPQILYNNLITGHPVLVTIMTGPSQGHAVVITAAFFVQTPSGLSVPSLVLRDPSPMFAFNGGRVQLDGPAATQFVSTVTASWVTWVTIE